MKNYSHTKTMKNKSKIFIFLTVMTAVFLGNFAILQNGKIVEASNLVEFCGTIPHFFAHEMVRDENIAFSANNSLSKHFDRDCITHTEFERFLTQMYDGGYALIDIYNVIGYDSNGLPYKKRVMFPKNKKPMLLSFDDMTYDSRGRGACDKVILTKDGKIASFTQSANPQIEYEKDNLAILEKFLSEHRDFSFGGARAIICPTGYNGILGYRINADNPNHKAETKRILPLIQKLKQLGYHFACHTYGHIQIADESAETIKKDLQKYQNEIVPVIGKTDILCFPCGSKTKSEYKMQVLKSFGYKIFLCVGLTPPIQKKYGCVLLDRKVLDGHSLRAYHKLYMPYFDTYAVYDNQKRKIKI